MTVECCIIAKEELLHGVRMGTATGDTSVLQKVIYEAFWTK